MELVADPPRPGLFLPISSRGSYALRHIIVNYEIKPPGEICPHSSIIVGEDSHITSRE